MIFKVGDVMQLKSGGPNMTVTEIHPEHLGGDLVCSWIDSQGKDHVQAYPAAVLQTSHTGPLMLSRS
jgi:uncharacterized protein YodC (DUF2158 family)